MPRPSRNPRELLTPAALHMLMALARGDLHGYGIKQTVEARTGGRLRLGPGTLYEAIYRMESAGWLREVTGDQGPGGKRKVYRLTASGRRVMEDELERLAEVVRFARAEDLLPEESS
jgi:DNA-binding PadR family transcriptional regulator